MKIIISFQFRTLLFFIFSVFCTAAIVLFSLILAMNSSDQEISELSISFCNSLWF